jgi:long-subunit fatty acid transport protein
MKKISIAIIALIISMGAMAQNQVDALRFSQITYGGTARSLAMGNAFGALGADFSTLSINPAGIGLYKSSEISFTPSVYTGKTKADYLGKTSEDIKYNFNISNLGIVFAIIPKKEQVMCKGIQIGFGVNRLANFNNATVIKGVNTENSILNDFMNSAQGTDINDLNPFGAQMAYNTYLIDTIGTSTDYISTVPRGGVMQTKSIETSGSVNEMVLTIGGNLNDRFYIGGTFGFPYLRYYEKSTYRENDEGDTIVATLGKKGFDEMTMHEDGEMMGTGFNFKLGMIYRIANWVRIGAAIHTPTFYNLKYKYSYDMSAKFDDGTSYNAESPKGSFDFKLNTPFRAIGSLAFVISKYALISAEYEFIDYSAAQLRSSTYEFFDENDGIHQSYTTASNIRAGVEIMIAPVCLRGGYQLNTSPYKDGINDGERSAFSGGIGIREKSYFIDLGYVYSKKAEDYYMYHSVPTAAVNNFSSNNFLLTLGYKF